MAPQTPHSEAIKICNANVDAHIKIMKICDEPYSIDLNYQVILW